MTSNTELLKIAQKYLGQGGSKFQKFCGLPSGAAWCNAFVDYIANEGGVKALYFNGDKPTYCPTSMKWCNSNLAQIPIYLALPMDIIYFDWEPNNVPNHIGFVRERKSDQEVYTIEGNTSGGIVAQKTRTVKYVCGCYRPHFKATFDVTKPLVVDGYFGYNSIARLQKALGITVDGILGQGTVKALQKKVNVTQDGSWGPNTSKAVQKLVGTTVDGAFGEKSVKALQTWINKQFDTTATVPVTTTSTTKTDTASQYKVIDVSVWQGTIDWAKVKADGVVGAIIRYADGNTLDSKFDQNMKNAKANGLHVGSYIFSRATTKAEAEAEATRLYNACKSYSPDMPLYIDLEVASLSKYANTVAQAFLNKMKSLGGRGGVYANLNWWNNYLADTANKYSEYPFWIAQYNDKMTHKTPSLFGMWQYSSTGKVNGISGNVDMDKCYIPYWETAAKTTVATAATSVSKTEGTKTMVNIPTAAEIKTASFSAFLYDIYQWSEKIAADKYHYVRWNKNVTATHTCPVCKGRKFDNYFGWNCIGFAFACWHHGGKLATNCNCHVVANGPDMDILNAKTDKEAYNLAVKCVGIKDIEVIRDGGKTIKSKIQAGDICWIMTDGKISHTYYYAGNGKYSDSTSGRSDEIKANMKASANLLNKTVLAIRYTGGRTYLSWGAKGEAVKKIQTILGITADGVWGPATDAAVRDYQKKNGLEVDGMAGPKTIAKMGEGSTSAPATPAPVSTKKKYSGTIPSLALKKSNAEVIADTIRWAKWIAGDNRFHYGKGSGAHHNGCYFCKTQDALKKNSGIVDYQFSYCCNPFAGAAWAHGGCDSTAMSLCKKRKTWDFNKGAGYDKSPKFTNLGHPAKSALKPGDVLCRDTHVAIYIGDGKIAEAGHEDDNKKNSSSWNSSIGVKTLTDKNYSNFPRVHRYNGSVDTSSMVISHGEISYRVKDLQAFLNWYFGKEVLTVDGIFGDKTYEYVKTFQVAAKIAADGIVGTNTLKKMREAEK